MTESPGHEIRRHLASDIDALSSLSLWRGEAEEARWMAEVLLITEEAAVAVAHGNLPIAVATTRYRVRRLSMTGAYQQVRQR